MPPVCKRICCRCRNRAEASRVKARAVQSRIFNTIVPPKTIQAVVSTFQDVGLAVEFLDDKLAIMFAKRSTIMNLRNWSTLLAIRIGTTGCASSPGSSTVRPVLSLERSRPPHFIGANKVQERLVRVQCFLIRWRHAYRRPVYTACTSRVALAQGGWLDPMLLPVIGAQNGGITNQATKLTVVRSPALVYSNPASGPA